LIGERTIELVFTDLACFHQHAAEPATRAFRLRGKCTMYSRIIYQARGAQQRTDLLAVCETGSPERYA
jgi:hypothetical protein